MFLREEAPWIGLDIGRFGVTSSLRFFLFSFSFFCLYILLPLNIEGVGRGYFNFFFYGLFFGGGRSFMDTFFDEGRGEGESSCI